MPYFNQEQIFKARQMDLLTYLRCYEPNELVHVGGNVYCTRSHDSLKISNGVWCWWSQGGIGGRSALDYLVKVRGMSFTDAVGQLVGTPIISFSAQSAPLPPPQPFVLPEHHTDNKRVFAYLCSRAVDPEIINHCIKHGRIYEEKRHHNAVFVGFEGATPRYATLRSTRSDSIFLRDVDGSDKRYSFSFHGTENNGALAVFECAIDLLSYLTLLKNSGHDWRKFNALSLSGVYIPKESAASIPLPIALKQYLSDNSQIRHIALCLDKDEVGRLAAQAIIDALPDLNVTYHPPSSGKDYNDLLRDIKGSRNPVKTRNSNERIGSAR